MKNELKVGDFIRLKELEELSPILYEEWKTKGLAFRNKKPRHQLYYHLGKVFKIVEVTPSGFGNYDGLTASHQEGIYTFYSDIVKKLL